MSAHFKFRWFSRSYFPVHSSHNAFACLFIWYTIICNAASFTHSVKQNTISIEHSWIHLNHPSHSFLSYTDRHCYYSNLSQCWQDNAERRWSEADSIAYLKFCYWILSALYVETYNHQAVIFLVNKLTAIEFVGGIWLMSFYSVFNVTNPP